MTITSATTLPEHKIRPDHRDRLAVVYVRQSTMHQVQRHQESTQRQYGLVDQACRLGWPRERVLVIDEDQGASGASAEGRRGFQRLLSEVALNNVGLILGVEMSRLARSCKDWYQLLELCALFRTLIADLDGLYDPAGYNDRLLLGLKGTMSEAELHVLKQRMWQGALQKAQRGELFSKAPIGYVREAAGNMQLEPDEQARFVVASIFELFERLGSASGVLKGLVEQGVRMPVRIDGGPHAGELTWRRPNFTTVRNILVHPIYAGAYAYGRTCQSPTTRRVRNVSQRLEQSEWRVLLKDRLPAYISWSQFERNQDQLQQNRSIAASRGTVRRGRALLVGLVVCGRCGGRLATRYQGRASQPTYSCCSAGALHGEPICQSVAARVLDEEVARLAMLALAPSSVEVSLRVADDVERQRELAERHWKHRLERARIEADRVRRQFERVEPENRLVARTLERAWEEKLSALQTLEAEYAQFERSKPRRLHSDEQAEIQRLAADLPGLWRADSTTDEDRKSILRQIVERIIVAAEGDQAETEWVELRVHWAGGQETYSRLRRPIGKSSRKSDWRQLLARLRELKTSGMSSHQIAERLQEEGFRPARARRINAHTVRVWLCRYGDGVRERETIVPQSPNEWTLQEVMARCGASSGGVRAWIDRGAVQARRTDERRPRWIITATPAELEAMAARLGRRRQPLSADKSMYAASPPKTDK